MASTFLGLQIGKSGLAAAQINLNITGHNMTNIDTKGYTRQKVNVSSVPPAGGGYLLNQITSTSNVGQGVKVLGVEQVRSYYLDEQYRNQYSAFCGSEYRSQGLSYLEGLFDELDEKSSLTSSISKFFDSMSSFSKDPTSESLRTNVQQQAVAMTKNFSIIYKEMVDLYNNQNNSIKTVATQINEKATQIAQLNEVISDYERSGETANDLRDKRNLLLDALSGYAQVTYAEDANGMVNVHIAGEALVDGISCNQILTTTGTDEVNDLSQQIADINQLIFDTAAGGGDTTALEADRTNLCTELSAVADITYSTNAAGMIGVSVGGSTVVNGSTFTAASSSAVIPFAGAQDKVVLKLGTTGLNTATVTGGELCAHLNLRDSGNPDNSGIPYYMNRLNNLTQTIVQTVNECMNAGYTYPDAENGNTSVNMVDFFEDFGDDYASVTAGNFSISAALSQSVWNIAASSKPIDPNASTQTTQTGNNEIALEMSELANIHRYGDSLGSLVSHLGLTMQSAKDTLDTQQSLLKSIDTQRKSVSGVSTDEETTNLIRYQQTYNACSRVITTMDEMLNVLISNMGLVGR